MSNTVSGRCVQNSEFKERQTSKTKTQFCRYAKSNLIAQNILGCVKLVFSMRLLKNTVRVSVTTQTIQPHLTRM